MPAPYSARTLVARGVALPAQVDRLNDLLAAADLGRPLGPPRVVAGVQTVVPVTGADPARLLAVLREAGARGEEVVELRPERPYVEGIYAFRSAKWPAGELAPTPVAEASVLDTAVAMPAWQRPPAGRRRPVVALLDTGVAEHPALAGADPQDPILLPGWAPPGLSPAPGPDPADPSRPAGHGTFVAGLIHATAPTAQLLSLRVTDAAGVIQESCIIEALSRLVRRHDTGERVDVVCMAFARPVDGTDDYPDLVAEQLRKLAHRGVLLVAAAGNGGSSDPVYPAGFAQHFPVDSVGSGACEADRAAYSNFGDWVRKWRDGTDAVSILPGGRYAKWSGSSFAAAVYVGEQARLAG